MAVAENVIRFTINQGLFVILQTEDTLRMANVKGGGKLSTAAQRAAPHSAIVHRFTVKERPVWSNNPPSPFPQ
ncbi:MAG: hypothetical protein HQL87_15985 [Magnetococcales bacterium]|nr:hypothetical protein [Magnetococcales bacterium]